MKIKKAAFIFVFITVALDMLALGVMVPVLPKLLVEMEGGSVERAAVLTGVFGFIWAGMQFLFAPLLGVLSDRFGRRPIILLSNLGLGLDYILMAWAPSIAWLVVGRLISGITAASFPTASAYIADILPPEKRAAKFGILNAAFGFGFIVGPAIGGALGEWNLRAPFWFAAILSLLNAAYGFFVLPESLPPAQRSPLSLDKINPISPLRFLKSHVGLLGLAIGAFFYFVAHEVLPSIFILYTDYRYHWSSAREGAVLAFVGVCSALVSVFLVGPLSTRFGDRKTLVFGLLFGIMAFVTQGAASSGWLFLCGIPMIALWGVTGPGFQSAMTRLVGPDEQGRLQGALGGLRGVAGMLGPLLFTQIFSVSISPGGSHPSWLIGTPFFVAAFLLGVSLWISFKVLPVKLSK